MSQAGGILHLEVETEEGRSHFELTPGKAIVVGRDEKAAVRIPRSSISHDHLKILWTGQEVVVSDLGSKFGTFRLPQDSPFKEASFPPVYPGVELRLFKSKIKLSWKKADVQVEPTEVVSGTSLGMPEPAVFGTKSVTEAPREKTKVPEIKRTVELEPVPVPRAPDAEPKVPAPAPLEAKVAAAESARKTMVPRFGRLGAFLIVTVSVLAWFIVLQGVASAPGVLLRAGGAMDAIALWTHFLARSRLVLIGLFLLWCIGGLRSLRQGARGASFGLGLVCWFVAAVWPFAWALRYGIGPKGWIASTSLYAESATAAVVPSSATADELQARVQRLKSLKTEFPGSSLLYKSLLDLQRARVLRECGGVGEAPWENKKVCLILLFAVSIETLEEIKPALLGDVAARASILLSLDGLTRLLSVEGASAPMIPFFLESLELVGLQKEKEDIAKILESTESEAAAKSAADTLKELRRRIEAHFGARQVELRYPASLRLAVPGPLESGI